MPHQRACATAADAGESAVFVSIFIVLPLPLLLAVFAVLQVYGEALILLECAAAAATAVQLSWVQLAAMWQDPRISQLWLQICSPHLALLFLPLLLLLLLLLLLQVCGELSIMAEQQSRASQQQQAQQSSGCSSNCR
jgi:hypothetical protein